MGSKKVVVTRYVLQFVGFTQTLLGKNIFARFLLRKAYHSLPRHNDRP